MSKLFCKYCKRFCDERCLHCAYMKEAELKEEEEKDDDEETEEIKERQSSRSRGASDASPDLRGLLSSADTDELITVMRVVCLEVADRLNIEAFITYLFSILYSTGEDTDYMYLSKIQDKLIEHYNKGGKEVV